jgi:hypothetical protein
MKKALPIAIILVMVFSAVSCGAPAAEKTESAKAPTSTPVVTAEALPSPAVTETPQPYPCEDEQGRTRYQLVINGETLETKNLPFSLSGEKGAYFPLEDVLSGFGVPCIINENSHAATGRVNGKVFSVQARVSEMTVGKSVLNAEVTPHYIDGCLYVPSFLFMELLDAAVDFTADRSGATLDTDIVIRDADSTTEGLSIPDNTFGDGSVELTLSAQRQSACAKLFLDGETDRGEEVLTAFMGPGETAILHFTAGTYALKLAYGDEWFGDDEAFGESGSYSATEPYTFEAGGSYRLESSSSGEDFYTDSQSGFTGN